MADEESSVPGGTAGDQKKSSGNAKTTLITVIGSVLVAGITTWGTIHANGTKIGENSQKLDQLQQKADDLSSPGTPGGTIIASVLTREQFARAAGDPPDFDLKTSKWGLADGGSVDGTGYASAASSSWLPNLEAGFPPGHNDKRLEEVTLGNGRKIKVNYYIRINK